MNKENDLVPTTPATIGGRDPLPSTTVIAGFQQPALLKMPAIAPGLASASQLAQAAAMMQLSLPTPAIGKALERIQKSWQMPLAINAFSASFGLAHRLPKMPALNFPTFDFPALKLPKIDWDDLHERDERALRFAAKHNWFIQPETTYTFTADIDGCAADVARLDQLFIEMTNELKSDILARLLRDYPKHGPLIEEMFRLHDEGRYLASIPLAMIAAEGIAYSVTEKSIFNTEKNRPAIAGWLEKQDLSQLAKAFLASLTEQHPMSKPRKGKLSRHRVLHGWDVDYGSEQFSLQAISLLGFVGWAFAADGLVKDNA